jgi:hypothetical protein
MKKGSRRKRVHIEFKTIHSDVKPSNRSRIIYIDEAANQTDSWRELLNAVEQDTGEPRRVFFTFRNDIDWDIDLTPTKAENRDPPALAKFLLSFATGRRADHMIGDLNERFARDCKEFGRHHAVRQYWKNARRSLAPLLWRAIVRMLKWAIVAAVKWYF